MKELVFALENANKAYAKGMPVITDSEYDIIWKKLHYINPNHPALYHTSKDPNLGLDYVIHKSKIMGTQKAFNMTDMKPFLQRFGLKLLIIEPKYDGVAAMLYQTIDGYILALHGDGEKGKDKSNHIPKIEFPSITKAKTSLELIIPNDVWKKSYGKNQRNTVAGWINRNDPTYENGVIHAVSHEEGICWSVIPPYNLDSLEELFLKLYHKWSKLYPMDGLMIKCADERDRIVASHNGVVNLWSIAWKPPISTKETEVVKVNWEVSRLGKIIPIIEYKPVELCGTVNRYVTGNNAKYVLDNNITVRSNIIIGKAGEIIPKILKVTKHLGRKECPDKCPDCWTVLDWDGPHLICSGDQCKSQIVKKLSYFYSDKGMEIKSIGETLIWEMLQNDTIKEKFKTHPWLLLNADDRYVDLISRVIGHKRAITWLNNRDKLSGTKNHAHLIAAFGEKGLAYKTALKCLQILKFGKSRGVMPRKGIAIFCSIIPLYERAVRDLGKDFTFLPLPEIAEVTYCITGSLSMARNDMVALLIEHKWQMVNQISKNVDYLILGDIEHVTTKQRKAMELGVKIINEDELNTIIGG